MSIKNWKDHSMLALLQDDYRRAYPQITIAIQREIEDLYQQLYGHTPENREQITAVFIGICDDQNRHAYETGIKCGVRLAIDLELDGMMYGGD